MRQTVRVELFTTAPSEIAITADLALYQRVTDGEDGMKYCLSSLFLCCLLFSSSAIDARPCFVTQLICPTGGQRFYAESFPDGNTCRAGAGESVLESIDRSCKRPEGFYSWQSIHRPNSESFSGRAGWFARANGCREPGKPGSELNLSFRAACYAHDLCYSSGRGKGACDNELHSNMVELCRQPRLNNEPLGACRLLSGTVRMLMETTDARKTFTGHLAYVADMRSMEIKANQILMPNNIYNFELANYSKYFIRHWKFFGMASKLDSALSHRDSAFIIRHGPRGKFQGYTFMLESTNYPNHYLMHTGPNGRVVLRNRADPKFFGDYAVFRVVPGLSRSSVSGEKDEVKVSKISFESASHPGHHIRHFNFELRLDRFQSGVRQYFDDATFTPRNAGK